MTPDLSYSSWKEREKKMCEDNKWDEQKKKCARGVKLWMSSMYSLSVCARPIHPRDVVQLSLLCAVVVVVVVVVVFCCSIRCCCYLTGYQ